MRFSFFTLAAATVCLAAGAFAAAPSAAAESGASVAVAAERHSNSVAASAPSSVAAMRSAPAVQSSAAASVFIEKNDDIDENIMDTIQLGALEDVASLLVSLVAFVLKALIHTVLGGLGLSMTDAQIEQVQQEALDQIQTLGGVDTLKQTVRAGGLQGLIQFIINIVIPIIKKIKDAAGGATGGQ